MKWLKPGKDNREERMNFVEYWVEYVRTHPDKVWSEQQNILINSAIQSARHIKLTPREYLKIKGEICTR
ncbi:MAG TPA: hypothetical protein VJI46_03600 [Candidatus Nanoarchaeia archaeon]|nr:hypothetical protein [Candidatus Nanoarchaeia archaeon]